ncbi:MAG: hypothetical protein F4051_12405, partial [Boseongicola sp. SB0670_bin_30]|nr:hypothetical protein [Boseongicola sp. SB0670_bin_30]
MTELRGWKDVAVNRRAGGLSGLAKGRRIQIVVGYGRFVGRNMIEVDADGARSTVSFEQRVVAASSVSVTLPFILHVRSSAGRLAVGRLDAFAEVRDRLSHFPGWPRHERPPPSRQGRHRASARRYPSSSTRRSLASICVPGATCTALTTE